MSTRFMVASSAGYQRTVSALTQAGAVVLDSTEALAQAAVLAHRRLTVGFVAAYWRERTSATGLGQ